MEFLNVYSSVVFVGKGFSPILIKSLEDFDILGEPDPKTQIILPLASQQDYPENNFKLVITPERIDLANMNSDFLPGSLKTLADALIKQFIQILVIQCSGIGFNLNVGISEEVLGMAGSKFCRDSFINIENLELKIGVASIFANTSKLIYVINNIKYSIEILPDFKSNGKNLNVNINAHQDVTEKKNLSDILMKYDEIKNYLNDFHDRFFGG